MTDNELPPTTIFDDLAKTTAIPEVHRSPGEANVYEDLSSLDRYVVLARPKKTGKWLVLGLFSERTLFQRLVEDAMPGYDLRAMSLSAPIAVPEIEHRDGVPHLMFQYAVEQFGQLTAFSPVDADANVNYAYECEVEGSMQVLHDVLEVSPDSPSTMQVHPESEVGDMPQTLIMLGYERAVMDILEGKVNLGQLLAAGLAVNARKEAASRDQDTPR